MSFGIVVPWISVHVANPLERPIHIAKQTGYLGLAISVGPAVGVMVSMLVGPLEAYTYASAGVTTMLFSGLNFLLVYNFFDDVTLLNKPASSPGKQVDAAGAGTLAAPAEVKPPKLLIQIVIVSIFCNTWAFMGGYESALTLVVNQWYGWTAEDSWQVRPPVDERSRHILGMASHRQPACVVGVDPDCDQLRRLVNGAHP
jgi:hypothetical protein